MKLILSKAYQNSQKLISTLFFKVIPLYLANSLLQCKSTIFLPSAMKLRRLCFYRCVSVHRGDAWSRGEGGVFSGDAGWVPGLTAIEYKEVRCPGTF